MISIYAGLLGIPRGELLCTATNCLACACERFEIMQERHRKRWLNCLECPPIKWVKWKMGEGATTLARLALPCEHYNVTADSLLGLTDEPRALKL